MTSPQTDIKQQTRRHRAPLIGMAAAVAFALVLFLGWLTWVAAYGNRPGAVDPGATPPAAAQPPGTEGSTR